MKVREVVAPVTDYRGEHEAPMLEDGCPMWDVTRNGIYPKDFYEGYAFKYYGSGEAMDTDAISKVLRRHNMPNAFVTVYRAIPKSMPRGTKINIGDWVTITRRYALEHGRASLQNNFRIIELLAHARDLFTDGNSMLEWGYDPQPRIMYNGSEIRAAKNPMPPNFEYSHVRQPPPTEPEVPVI